MTAPPRGKGATDEGDWVGIYHVGHTPGDDGSHDWSYHGSASGSGSVDAPSAQFRPREPFWGPRKIHGGEFPIENISGA